MNDVREASRIGGLEFRDYPHAREHISRQALAFVLAGGRGTRLSPLTDRRAKPAVPFGGTLRIVDFTLSNCVNSGIRRIGIATQYQTQSLARHVQRGWSFLNGRFDEFVALLPAQEGPGAGWYKGTADAVFQNLHLLHATDARVVLILAGDHVYKMDYARLIEAHLDRDAPMTVACTEVPLTEASQFGVMEVDRSDRIVGFEEKPARPKVAPEATRVSASMGIYAFDPRFLYEQLRVDAADARSDHDFGNTIIPRLIDAGCDVGAFRFARDASCASAQAPYWRDVGTLGSYWRANMDLLEPRPALDLHDRRWPVWAAEEHLPPARFACSDESRRGALVDCLVAGGCSVAASTLQRSALFANVRVDTGCEVEESLLLPGVELARGVRLRKVVVDEGTRIPAGLSAGFDPEADRQRFHVSPEGITVINDDMISGRKISR
jgi:glucose-1-phosphate adenylyltransferase